jgi:hypothetical protein
MRDCRESSRWIVPVAGDPIEDFGEADSGDAHSEMSILTSITKMSNRLALSRQTGRFVSMIPRFASLRTLAALRIALTPARGHSTDTSHVEGLAASPPQIKFIPISRLQRAVYAVGSAFSALLNPMRGGESSGDLVRITSQRRSV